MEMEEAEVEVSVVQLPNETVEVSGFRYVLILSGKRYPRTKARAFQSLYMMGDAFNGDEWRNIEASLAKHGAWKAQEVNQTLLAFLAG